MRRDGAGDQNLQQLRLGPWGDTGERGTHPAIGNRLYLGWDRGGGTGGGVGHCPRNPTPRADGFQAAQPSASLHNLSGLTLLPRGGYFSSGTALVTWKKSSESRSTRWC